MAKGRNTSPPARPKPVGPALLSLVVALGRPTHAYEIVQIIRERGGALGVSESTIYRELGRLVERGDLESAEAVRHGSSTRVLSVNRTPRGVATLQAFVESPVALPEVDISELVPRLRAARLVPPGAVANSLRGLEDLLTDAILKNVLLEQQAKKSGDWDEFVKLEYALRDRQLRGYSGWTTEAIASLEDSLAGERATAADEDEAERLRRIRDAHN